MKTIKRALLINPWIYDFKAFDSWVKPLGLLYIADILKKNGFEIYIIDCLDRADECYDKSVFKDDRIGCGQYYREEIDKPEILKIVPRIYKRYGIPEKIFIEKLKSMPNPDIILVTSYMTYWYPGVFHAIKLLKNRFKDSLIVLGGIYATLCYEHAKKFSNADYVWQGGFNQESLNLINDLTKNNLEVCFDNIFSFLPDYSLYKKINSVAIITSLGCPYTCTYCASKLIQPKFCMRNIKNIVSEIKFYYEQYKIRHIAFYDDALLFNSQNHIEPLLDELIHLKMNVNFYTPNGLHARFINKSIARKMKEVGFNELRISLETQDPDIQAKSGGKISNDEFSHTIDILREAGFASNEIGIYTMIGLKIQKYEDIIKTIEFVHNKKLKIKLVSLSPLPGTYEWSQLSNDMQEKLSNEPMLQNDLVYINFADDFNFSRLESVKKLVRKLNQNICGCDN